METCARCGAFAELQTIGSARYCAACAARPEIGVVEKFRAAHLGRRDVYAWLVGGLAPIALWAALSGFLQRQWPYAILCVCLGAAQLLFWKGVAWARPMPLAAAAIGLGLGFAAGWSAPGVFVLPLVFAAAAYRDPICQLFFRAEVPEERLRPAVERLQHNELSRTATVLAASALLLPWLWPLGMGFTVAALSRVDSSASPPVGRGLGLRALILATVVPLLFCVLFVALYQVFQHTSDAP